MDGDQNVVRSNGGGFSKYTMMIPHPPPPMNGYDDQRSQGFFYDQRIARSAPVSASMNPYFNEATNLTVISPFCTYYLYKYVYVTYDG